MPDWKKEYKLKEDWFQLKGYKKISRADFYRDLFPAKYIQEDKKIKCGKGNIVGIIHENKSDYNESNIPIMIQANLDGLKYLKEAEFTTIAPCTYFGRKIRNTDIDKVFAIVIDIDKVMREQLANLLKQLTNEGAPTPNYIVSSGVGVHLYYLLRFPLQYTYDLDKTLTPLKHELIKELWNTFTSVKVTDAGAPMREYASITQSFRTVGSASKLGADYPAVAYRMRSNKWEPQELAESVRSLQHHEKFGQIRDTVFELRTYSDAERIEEMRKIKRYFSERDERIKNNIPTHERRVWHAKRALYEWWLRVMMSDELKQGGRYFSVVALCAFGRKCGVSDAEIIDDARTMLSVLDKKTEDEFNHFTEKDLEDALNVLSQKGRLRLPFVTRRWIEEKTGVVITPQIKRRPKPLKQDVHLKLCRQTLKTLEDNFGREWRKYAGRPKGVSRERDAVIKWRKENPDGRKVDCIRDLGLSKPTVYRWWNDKYSIERDSQFAEKEKAITPW